MFADWQKCIYFIVNVYIKYIYVCCYYKVMHISYGSKVSTPNQASGTAGAVFSLGESDALWHGFFSFADLLHAQKCFLTP